MYITQVMLGALGGVTVIAIVVSRNEIKPPVVLFWLLFVLAALVHSGVLSL